jgi:hypothetical protein
MQMSRQPYPSDITRKQFERIRPLMEGARSSTRPREIDLYEVFCAVLYLLKTGSRSPGIFRAGSRSMLISESGRKWMRMEQACWSGR